MSRVLTIAEAVDLSTAILIRRGASQAAAGILSSVIVAAERDGSRSHGLSRLADYIASIRAGWITPEAMPDISFENPPIIRAQGNNGFTQVAAHLAAEELKAFASRFGLAALATRNSHHIGALWCDIEPLAEAGFVAINFVNSRPRLAPYGAGTKLLGTNAMAFAFPDGRGGAVTWDQASSPMSLGDVKLHANEGKPLPAGVGLDADGQPTTDASVVMKGGPMLPFAGHKGSSIALMVEVMAAGLTGAGFGFQDTSSRFPGAASSNAGQFILVVDPRRTDGEDFPGRIAALVDHLHTDPAVRLPGERRKKNRERSLREGITISQNEHDALTRLLNS